MAITCHRCGINVFEYLCDIIDRCAAWFPNTSIEKYRDLLPGKWKQTQKGSPDKSGGKFFNSIE
ncbi:transposase domain-containing protein, partial [Phocaeicola vulgatus]